MDIEKLIEQLRYLADTPSYTAFHSVKEREIICDQCEADFCHDKLQDAHWCMYEALSRAATALSTLQAENARLRKELEYEREHANAYHEECGQWEAENEKLRADLDRVTVERDAAVADLVFIKMRRKTPAFRHGDISRSTVGHTGSHARGDYVRPACGRRSANRESPAFRRGECQRPHIPSRTLR